MKAEIHPAYDVVTVNCACGNSFQTRSTHKGDIHVEICSNCHPFFTGKQKLIDTAGRVERFRKRYKGPQGRSQHCHRCHLISPGQEPRLGLRPRLRFAPARSVDLRPRLCWIA